MSLETSHQSSPWRGSAFSQRFLTSSCCSCEEEKTVCRGLLMLWFVPAERWKIKVPSLIQTLIQSFPPTSLKGSLEAWVKILLPHWTSWPNNSRASFGNTKETAAETSFVLPPAWDRSSERSLWSQKINTPITSVISGSKNHRKRLEQIVPTAVSTCNLHLTLVQMWGRAAHIQHCSYRKVSSEEVRILQKQD